MHVLRFGSSIPGAYMFGGGGCCACEIIQGFSKDPDTPASIQVVNGDGGYPCNDYFLGKTYREIFEARMRIGTFSDDDLPNHAFLAILTQSQIGTETGKKWLSILKENGFEFIRAFDNSVYSGDELASNLFTCDDPDEYDDGYLVMDSHPNYLFGLFRNIGNGKLTNPFQPPIAWTELEQVIPEAYQGVACGGENISREMEKYHEKQWKKLGPVKFYNREELEEEKVPVFLAGVRSQYPEELASVREEKMQLKEPAKAAPF